MKLPILKNLLSYEDIKPSLEYLPRQGTLIKTNTGLVCLDIDDNYIHQLFPFIDYTGASKPNYFAGAKNTGAHISLFYADELATLTSPIAEIGKSYSFAVAGIFSTAIASKMYYAIAVEAPGLTALREQYGFNPQLNFKGYAMNLHITIGTKQAIK